jgi:hypothetical protein
MLVLCRGRWVLTALLVAAGARPVAAQPSVLWSPSPVARNAIELLADEAGLDLVTTQWPLPAAAVQSAVGALPAVLPPALLAAREVVLRELAQQQDDAATIDVASHAEVMPGYGDSGTPGSFGALRSAENTSEYVAAQIGARIEAKADVDRPGATVRLDDSTLASEVGGWQLQAWSHRSWWSPGWQNALALSNNAPALDGIGFQRARASTSDSPWLSWLGPWNFDAFIAGTEDVPQPASRPYLIGMRATLHPWPWFELGLTKMSQWGAAPHSVKSFFNILLGNHTNADYPGEQAQDPGNGLAGFDWRLRCPAGARCSIYGQLIGEDEAGRMPSKYLGMYGAEHWSGDGTQRWFLEYAETTCGAPLHRGVDPGCAYRNYAFPSGYASAGRWIGDSLGPDSTLATLGWLDAAHDRELRLHYGYAGARIGNFSAVEPDPTYSGRLTGVDFEQGMRIGAFTVRPHISLLHTSAPTGSRNDVNAGVQLSVDLQRLPGPH